MTSNLKPLRVLYHSAACIRPAAIATVPQDGRGEVIANLTEYGAPYARLLAEAPAMLEALRYFLPVLANHIGQEVSESEIADLRAILARIDGEA